MEKKAIKDALKAFLKILIPVEFQDKFKTTYFKVSYYGFRYRCPLCNSHLRSFLPFGLKVPSLKEKKVV
jgi:hypothetical protein